MSGGAFMPALDSLLDDVCTSERTAAVVDRWGVEAESQLRPDGVRVECRRPSPFAALEIRPWDGGGDGLVDIEFVPGAPLPHWPELRVAFGPFEEALGLEGVGPQYLAVRIGPADAGADALLIVGVDEEVVTSLTIRRDRRAR